MSDEGPAEGRPATTAGIDLDAAAGGATVETPARGRAPVAARHYLWIVAAAIVVVLALHWLGPVLTPFLIGAILAYLGTPLVDALERRGVHRTLGTTLTVLVFAIAITGLLVVLVPLVQAEVSQALRRLPELVDRLARDVLPWIEEHLGVRIALDLA